jgi:hypothetical protein
MKPETIVSHGLRLSMGGAVSARLAVPQAFNTKA